MKLVIEDEAGTRSIVPSQATDRRRPRRGGRHLPPPRSERLAPARPLPPPERDGIVEDLGSLTGTRVNGDRLAGRRKLRDGDLVQIGDYDLAVLAEGVSVAPGAPPPLPAAGHAEDATVQLPAPIYPTPPSISPSWAAPAPRRTGRGRAVKLALAAGAVALALGLALAGAAGALGR
jgi:hypothetical protein